MKQVWSLWAVTAIAGIATEPDSVFRESLDCPEMVVIPAGSFMMGSSDSEKDSSGETPRFTTICCR